MLIGAVTLLGIFICMKGYFKHREFIDMTVNEILW